MNPKKIHAIFGKEWPFSEKWNCDKHVCWPACIYQMQSSRYIKVQAGCVRFCVTWFIAPASFYCCSNPKSHQPREKPDISLKQKAPWKQLTRKTLCFFLQKFCHFLWNKKLVTPWKQLTRKTLCFFLKKFCHFFPVVFTWKTICFPQYTVNSSWGPSQNRGRFSFSVAWKRVN